VKRALPNLKQLDESSMPYQGKVQREGAGARLEHEAHAGGKALRVPRLAPWMPPSPPLEPGSRSVPPSLETAGVARLRAPCCRRYTRVKLGAGATRSPPLARGRTGRRPRGCLGWRRHRLRRPRARSDTHVGCECARRTQQRAGRPSTAGAGVLTLRPPNGFQARSQPVVLPTGATARVRSG
jgi:hypothetical protein